MSTYNTSSEINVTIDSITSFETPTSRTVKFILLITSQLPAIGCSLLIFVYLIAKTTLRQALHNHSIIALIIMSFLQTSLDTSLVLDYLRRGEASSANFCLVWNYLAFAFHAVCLWTMAWAAFERHIIIIHHHLLRTARSKFFLHYTPLFACHAIPLIYYLFLVFFYPCTNRFNYTVIFCGYCCYANNAQLVMFNWFAFALVPTSLLTILSTSLLIRVVMQKRHAHQQFRWSRYRLMIIQIFSLACLYMFFAIALVIVGVIQTINPTFAAKIQSLYLYYIAYLLPPLVPVFYLITFYKLVVQKPRQVRPLMMAANIRLNRNDEGK